MKPVIIVPLLFVLINCRSQSSSYSEEKEIIFDKIKGDSTLVFYGSKGDTLNIFRKIKVLENYNTDTVILGYAIIPPHFIGDIYFIQNGLDKSKAVYIDKRTILDPDSMTSYAKLFTIGLWGKDSNVVLRHLKVKISLKQLNSL